AGSFPSCPSATYGRSFSNTPGCTRAASHPTQPVMLDPVPRVESPPDLIDVSTNRSATNYHTSQDNSVIHFKAEDQKRIQDSDHPVRLDPAPPVEVQPEVFDANSYRSPANYLYSWVNGVIRDKVKDVEGIPDWDDANHPPEVRRNGYFYRTANNIDPSNPGWA